MDAQLGDMATPTNNPALTVLPHVHAVILKFKFPGAKCAVLATLDQPHRQTSSEQLVLVCNVKISAVKPASAIFQNEKPLSVQLAFD